jgi:NADPH:quinone reductase
MTVAAASPATYRAYVITRPGGPEVLQERELAVTAPGPGELRVRVRACGLGATDLTMLSGKYRFAPKLPIVGGYEIAGEVEAIGPGVSGFHIGQRVAALTVHGGFAERLTREARHFVPIPDGVSDVEAASVVLNYVTAWQMIHRVASVRPGTSAHFPKFVPPRGDHFHELRKVGTSKPIDSSAASLFEVPGSNSPHVVRELQMGGTSALVTAAGGGVGTALLQLLRLAGVTAYGAASPSKHDLVRELGGIPLDYRTAPVDQLVRAFERGGVDIAFDALGGHSIAACLRAVRRGGTVIGYGFVAAESGAAKLKMFFDVFIGARLRGRRGAFYGISLLYRKDPAPFLEDLPKIFALVARGKIKPVIAEVMPLAEVKGALEMLASGHVAGKIVLRCD